jgi:hypothetical protein
MLKLQVWLFIGVSTVAHEAVFPCFKPVRRAASRLRSQRSWWCAECIQQFALPIEIGDNAACSTTAELWSSRNS